MPLDRGIRQELRPADLFVIKTVIFQRVRSEGVSAQCNAQVDILRKTQWKGG